MVQHEREAVTCWSWQGRPDLEVCDDTGSTHPNEDPGVHNVVVVFGFVEPGILEPWLFILATESVADKAFTAPAIEDGRVLCWGCYASVDHVGGLLHVTLVQSVPSVEQR